jgi:hypothetical protein
LKQTSLYDGYEFFKTFYVSTKVVHLQYIYLLLQLQHIYLHISGVILQNLDWLQLKFDFVSGTATISTEFSSGLKFPPISNETAA